MIFCDHCDRPVFDAVHRVIEVVTGSDDQAVVHQHCAAGFVAAGGRLYTPEAPLAVDDLIQEVDHQFIVAEPRGRGFCAPLRRIPHQFQRFTSGGLTAVSRTGVYRYSRRRDAVRRARACYDGRIATE